MSIEEAVIETLQTLPPEKRQEVLDFAKFLAQPRADGKRPPFRSSMGVAAGLGPVPTTEDIDEARREMWSGYMGGDDK